MGCCSLMVELDCVSRLSLMRHCREEEDVNILASLQASESDTWSLSPQIHFVTAQEQLYVIQLQKSGPNEYLEAFFFFIKVIHFLEKKASRPRFNIDLPQCCCLMVVISNGGS